MYVDELNDDQISVLKSRLFYEYDEELVDDGLTDDEIDVIHSCDYPDQIPDDIVFNVFDGIDFVEDDF